MNEKVLCDKSDLVAIADMVRENTDSVEKYSVVELKNSALEMSNNINMITNLQTTKLNELKSVLESKVVGYGKNSV